MPPRMSLKKPAAKKPAPAAAVRDDLVAPPVFARILPKNVGGHRDDGKAVAKRLKSWSEEKDDARVTLSDGHGETHYTFPTRVFGPDASQEELFNEVAGPLLEKFLHASDPQSAFLFAYGQTGTGKTHTIMGPEESWDEVRHSKWGLFPRIVDAVLTTMRGRDASHAFSCTLSAVEFYFCQGFDLLDDHAQVDVRDGDLLGRKQVEVKTLADVLKVLAAVREHRTTASTKMNPALKAAGGKEKDNKTHGGSSRSHCVLHCVLRLVDRSTRDVKTVSFGTMDLAGAERPKSNAPPTISRWNRRTDRTTARCNRPDFLEFSYKIPKILIARDNDSRISLFFSQPKFRVYPKAFKPLNPLRTSFLTAQLRNRATQETKMLEGF